MNDKNIIIDIGANHGDFCLEIAKRNPNIDILAFEPEPSLYRVLEKEKKSLQNLKLYKFALANIKKKEIRDFHVSHEGDMGVSSLLEFNNNNLKKNDYWKRRSDLKHDEVIQVEVISLSSMLDVIDYDEIAFIKIDSQGFDLDILKSAGEHFHRIQAGMLEAPATPETSLYYNEKDTLVDILNFLKEKDYKIYQIKPNDEAGCEYNVYFCRKDVDIKALEKKYYLENLSMYDGKNYWFLPSNSPILSIDLNLINRIDKLERTILDKLNLMEKQVRKIGFFKRLLTCIMPNKKLRKKIRGEI